MKKTIPGWLALLLVVEVAVWVGVVEYYWLRREFSRSLNVQTEIQDSGALVKKVRQRVLPVSGYETSLVWGDIGKRLVETKAIDKGKYGQIFRTPAEGLLEMDILAGNSEKKIAINENNTRFLVDTLWALGLVNKSLVLEEMAKKDDLDVSRLASTGGWALGAKAAMELYNSEVLIALTNEQQRLVKKIAENVYRPCCGNHTAMPDCNHGMAALGYIELAVAKGLSEGQIYQDLLAFNSFWFPTTYVEMGVFFEKEKGLSWEEVDPKLALSGEYSSFQGAQRVKEAVANVPGIQSQGGSCGA